MNASPSCPGCSGPLGAVLNHRTIKQHPSTEIRECLSCGGLIGRVHQQDLNQYVILEFHTPEKDGPFTEAETRYFDLDVLDENRPLRQTYRTHGWYIPRSKRVVQFG